MKITGNLSVMSLPDVLQWIANAHKTGRLDVEQKNAHRAIYCRGGQVVACSSDDPSMLMGQFLICHGWIDEETLRRALARQERMNANLGRVLVEMGAIGEDQLLDAVASKAMETIHGMFDWHDAAFEFVPDSEPIYGTIEVDLRIEEILLEGAHRTDRMNQIRTVFTSSDVILAPTERQPDTRLLASPMAHAIYEAIDGKRTIAEICLTCRASEFMACQFLLELYEGEFVAIRGVRQAGVEAPEGEQTLEAARRLMDHGDYYAAIGILEPLFDQSPNDPAIKTTLADAEARFVVAAYRGGLHPESVPRVEPADESLAKGLSATALHLLGKIDGATNVKAILWVVPMRPAHVLWTLKTLEERGLIGIRQPSSEEAADATGGSSKVVSFARGRS